MSVVPSGGGACGLIVAAPASGSGKTVLTLGLLRHLKRSGVAVASAKAGPDYIDPAFHAAASGRPCPNLDVWAMAKKTLAGMRAGLAEDCEIVICEGVMGLFDGATADRGSTADLAELTGWPVVLVIDARAQGASAAAVLRGFATHRPGIKVAAAVFNRVGSENHARAISEACAATVPEVGVLGFLPREDGLSLPARHLGLVQASEHAELEAFLDRAAGLVAESVDVAALRRLARPWAGGGGAAAMGPPPLPPLGQRIAIADDRAFGFAYRHVIEGWRAAGAAIETFSPLAGEAPWGQADAVYLPGGYPELHAGRLAAATGFLDGLAAAAGRGAAVYGECGGYMVLGRGLVDKAGRGHAMAGLLPLETSFAEPRLHLGYRRAELAAAGPLGAAGTGFKGHEFHYAASLKEGPAESLFNCADAHGKEQGKAGLAAGRVMGSFIHLIDRDD